MLYILGHYIYLLNILLWSNKLKSHYLEGFCKRNYIGNFKIFRWNHDNAKNRLGKWNSENEEFRLKIEILG